MCISLKMKTLNPRAKEWRPKPQQPPPRLQPHQFLPHLMIPPPPQPLAAPPPPQQAAPVVVLTPTPPPHHFLHPYTFYHPNHQCYYTTYNVIHSGNNVFVYHSSPAAEFFSTAAKSSYADDTEAFIPGGNTTNTDEKEMENTPIGDENPRCKGIFRGILPPRLKRGLTSTATPPPPNQEYWRPKKSAVAESKISGDGGAAVFRRPFLPPPPPSSGGDFSRSSHTTVMMKNIPNHLRRDFMLEFLDECCKAYNLEYDFLYLPMDFRKKDNLGYAFVNLTSAAAAKKFKMKLNNLKWQKVSNGGRLITSTKICEITWARIQGKEALIKRFQNSFFRCDKLEYLPVLLDPPRNGSGKKRAPPVVIGKIIH